MTTSPPVAASKSDPERMSGAPGAAFGQTGFVIGMPRVLLRLEGAAAFVLAVAFYGHLGGSWLWFAVGFLLPDLSMLGYLIGPRWGASIYNLAHSYAGPALLGFCALAIGGDLAVLAAAIWAAHIGLDRLLGFGLKYGSAFADTHLGRAGWKI
jgi:hypothetical protein